MQLAGETRFPQLRELVRACEEASVTGSQRLLSAKERVRAAESLSTEKDVNELRRLLGIAKGLSDCLAVERAQTVDTLVRRMRHATDVQELQQLVYSLEELDAGIGVEVDRCRDLLRYERALDQAFTSSDALEKAIAKIDGMLTGSSLLTKAKKTLANYRLAQDGTLSGVHHAACLGNIPALEMILRAGIASEIVRMRTDQGQTPLHAACRAGRIEAAHMLVTHGADLDAVAQDGYRCVFSSRLLV